MIDNVGLGLKGQWRDAALQALASVGWKPRGDWPAALSGGQKTARCAGCALIHRRLLLLDEPLGALDALTRLEMRIDRLAVGGIRFYRTTGDA